jgi:hypothetical protein
VDPGDAERDLGPKRREALGDEVSAGPGTGRLRHRAILAGRNRPLAASVHAEVTALARPYAPLVSRAGKAGPDPPAYRPRAYSEKTRAWRAKA